MKTLAAILLLLVVVNCGCSENAKTSSKLFACEDCERLISKRAESCPHCGAPNDQIVSTQTEPEPSPIEKLLRAGKATTIEPQSIVKTLKGIRGHEGEVFSVAFSPDGKTIASGSSDGTVRIWDVETVR
tara:strand:+ start:447 stop:833 length:387 start_codon:yes stop_codon:yes gene_type:complete